MARAKRLQQEWQPHQPRKKPSLEDSWSVLLSGFFCFVGLFTFSINQSGGGDEAAQQMWAIGTAFCIWLASWIIPLIPRMQTAREYNENTLPKLIREWEQSFACERCGTIFRTEASEHATVARS